MRRVNHVHHWLLDGADTAEKLPGENKPRIWGRCKNPKCPVKRRRFNPVGWDEHLNEDNKSRNPKIRESSKASQVALLQPKTGTANVAQRRFNSRRD